ncbi:MFS transporter [Mesobacillus maritimus]|uniref:MFS transporter n=1 Tax=Mesobacillus maritimus TaxID=1643336 RepID=UPI002041A1E5|nr:MFS transporter [Mesobacillus maritimus]MCM3584573.1 MFS transporter [Mesobacillus maritimus]MCM3670648.1 MFS transporter [Mesobacillus maritimus]
MERKQNNHFWIYGIVGMLTTMVVLAFARLSFGVILPFMKEGLEISYQEAGYLGTTTSLGYLGTVVFAGILASKWGGRRTVLLGISLVTFGFLGLSFSSWYGLTIVFMLFLGVGTAFTYTPFISLVVAQFPLQKGLIIGLVTSGAGIGMLLAGIIVPYLAGLYPIVGWRVTWGFYAAIGFIVLILSLLFIQNPPVAKSETKADTSNTRIKNIYKNSNVIRVGVLYGIVGLTYIVQVIFVMSFMIESGISTAIAGRLMAINGILSIFSGFIWGAISDRLGRRFSLMATTTITTIAMMIPVFFPTLLGFSLHIILMSCTVTGLFTLVQASSMDYVKPSEMSIAFGYVTFYFALGQFIGPTIAGAIIEGFGGFRTAFFLCAVCLGVGFLLTIKMKNSEEVHQVDQPLTIES